MKSALFAVFCLLATLPSLAEIHIKGTITPAAGVRIYVDSNGIDSQKMIPCTGSVTANQVDCIVPTTLPITYIRISILNLGWISQHINILKPDLGANGSALIDLGNVSLKRLPPRTPKDFTQARALQLNAAANSGPLAVLSIVRDEDATLREEPMGQFDVLLKNVSGKTLTIVGFDYKWTYYNGGLASIEPATTLKPISEYVITFPIRPDRASKQFSEQKPATPFVQVPDGAEVVLRLVLSYYFSGSLNYHPTPDWDLRFSINLMLDSGQEAAIWTDEHWKHLFASTLF
jgi:hypothetical protein